MRIERFRWIAILPFVLLGFTGCDDDNCTNVVYRVPPPVPTGVYTVTGDGLVQVYWSPIRGIDVRRFGVWRSLVPEGPYEWVADVSPSDDPHYIDSGLQNGVTYYYAVDAQNDYGESKLSYEKESFGGFPGYYSGRGEDAHCNGKVEGRTLLLPSRRSHVDGDSLSR